VPVILAAATVAGVGFFILGVATSLLVALLVAVIAGVSRSLLEVTGQTLLQRITPTRLLARVFAFKEGLAMAAWALGSAAIPLLVVLSGTTGAILFTGAIVPFVVLLRLPNLLAVDAAARVPAVTIALLHALPLFRLLPVPALEGVASEATELAVAPRTVIVREGERGGSYFAVADGAFEVATDGRVVSRLERGEGFGEIALLHDGVRTATVTALTSGRLIAIEREPFLVAVTGHGETTRVAEEIARERQPEPAAASP
jgi:MFS family permease